VWQHPREIWKRVGTARYAHYPCVAIVALGAPLSYCVTSAF
jgi:hypothetical protein